MLDQHYYHASTHFKLVHHMPFPPTKEMKEGI